MQAVGNRARNGAGTCDGPVVGEGHTAAHSQGSVFRYGQCFARWDFYILLQGWISVDCATIPLEDKPAPAVLVTFVTDATICNNQGMTVRSGCKGVAACTLISNADSGCVIAAGCGDTAAGDGNIAGCTLISAADSGSSAAADCSNIAAVDGHCAARTPISAAVDGDGACIFPVSATDSGFVVGFILSCQNAHISTC